jgi:hypothetical protein
MCADRPRPIAELVLALPKKTGKHRHRMSRAITTEFVADGQVSTR